MDASMLEILRLMPYSTFFVAAIALLLNLTANLVTKAKVDLEAFKRVQHEYSRYQKQLRDAMRKGEMEKVEKLKKKYKPLQDRMLRMQGERFKVSLYYLIPFMILYFALASFMGGTPVALSPYHFDLYFIRATHSIGGVYSMNLVTWYIFTSVAFGVVMGRWMGTY